jgi:hypothetical protein
MFMSGSTPTTLGSMCGVAYLMVGDIDAGLAKWRQSPSGAREMIYRFTVHAEPFLKASVINDQRYQTYLDELGIGRQWTAFLRSKVAELAPITGIEPSDSTPQLALSRSD